MICRSTIDVGDVGILGVDSHGAAGRVWGGAHLDCGG